MARKRNFPSAVLTGLAGALIMSSPELSAIDTLAPQLPVFTHTLPELTAFLPFAVAALPGTGKSFQIATNQRALSSKSLKEFARPLAFIVGPVFSVVCIAASIGMYANNTPRAYIPSSVMSQLVLSACLIGWELVVLLSAPGEKQSSVTQPLSQSSPLAEPSTQKPALVIFRALRIVGAILWRLSLILYPLGLYVSANINLIVLAYTCGWSLLLCLDIALNYSLSLNEPKDASLTFLAILVTASIGKLFAPYFIGSFGSRCITQKELVGLAVCALLCQGIALLARVITTRRVRAAQEAQTSNASQSSETSGKLTTVTTSRKNSQPKIEAARTCIEQLESASSLSKREQEVLACTIAGMATPDIAARLQISTSTVSTYRSRGIHKLGFASKDDLISEIQTHLLTKESAELIVGDGVQNMGTSSSNTKPCSGESVGRLLLDQLARFATRAHGSRRIILANCTFTVLVGIASSVLPLMVTDTTILVVSASLCSALLVAHPSTKEPSPKKSDCSTQRYPSKTVGALCGVACSLAISSMFTAGQAAKPIAIIASAILCSVNTALGRSDAEPENATNKSTYVTAMGLSFFTCNVVLLPYVLVAYTYFNSCPFLLALSTALTVLAYTTQKHERKIAEETSQEIWFRDIADQRTTSQESVMLYLRRRGMSETQARVLLLTALGLSRKSIANIENVAPATVDSYRSRGYSVLLVKGREELQELLATQTAFDPSSAWQR